MRSSTIFLSVGREATGLATWMPSSDDDYTGIRIDIVDGESPCPVPQRALASPFSPFDFHAKTNGANASSDAQSEEDFASVGLFFILVFLYSEEGLNLPVFRMMCISP